MYPSARPDWPGRELMQASSLCCPNCSATFASITLVFFLSYTLSWARFDFLSQTLASFPFLVLRLMPQWLEYHWLKGVASIWTTQFFTKVLVLTNSLLDALQTTSRILVLRVTASEAQLKFPSLSLRALNLQLPPLTLTLRILAASETSLVLARGLAFQKALFFLWIGILPPVSLRLCLESLLIPIHYMVNLISNQILFISINPNCHLSNDMPLQSSDYHSETVKTACLLIFSAGFELLVNESQLYDANHICLLNVYYVLAQTQSYLYRNQLTSILCLLKLPFEGQSLILPAHKRPYSPILPTFIDQSLHSSTHLKFNI